ncbi:MAG: Gfo/Idh/MocA family protein, partial [Chthoniobacterales bacterium]
MSNKLKAGVVGVGSMGWNHARIYSELDNAELAAIYDANTAAAEKAVRKFGGTVAKSLDDIIARCDAVSVAAPTNLHHEIVMKLL